MKPTYLYIKEHTITGLKYFGKTTKSDPTTYDGSGKVWVNHINKHGRDHIKTTWYKLFTDENELRQYAQQFSVENDIVSSSEWANLRPENGFDGGGWPIGYKHKEETIEVNRQKAKQRWADGKYDAEQLRLSRIGFKQPQSQKDKVAEFNSVEWLITSPDGQKQTITNLNKFCRDMGWGTTGQSNLSRGKYKGWAAQKVI